MKHSVVVAIVAFATSVVAAAAGAPKGDLPRAQRAFGACAACHSLEPDRNMTGPSLAELWNRKAGTLPSFQGYPPALKSSDVVWDDKTLDAWLADSQHLVPGNTMTFQGIKNAQQRADLLAFLKQVTQPGHAPSQSAQRGGQQGGTGGMRGGGSVPNLRKLDLQNRVQSIRYCGDTYKGTTADGKTREVWERSLRFKNDSSEGGPEKGAPAIIDAGMMGDRADAIFASPEDISAYVEKKC